MMNRYAGGESQGRNNVGAGLDFYGITPASIPPAGGGAHLGPSRSTYGGNGTGMASVGARMGVTLAPQWQAGSRPSYTSTTNASDDLVPLDMPAWDSQPQGYQPRSDRMSSTEASQRRAQNALWTQSLATTVEARTGGRVGDSQGHRDVFSGGGLEGMQSPPAQRWGAIAAGAGRITIDRPGVHPIRPAPPVDGTYRGSTSVVNSLAPSSNAPRGTGRNIRPIEPWPSHQELARDNTTDACWQPRPSPYDASTTSTSRSWQERTSSGVKLRSRSPTTVDSSGISTAMSKKSRQGDIGGSCIVQPIRTNSGQASPPLVTGQQLEEQAVSTTSAVAAPAKNGGGTDGSLTNASAGKDAKDWDALRTTIPMLPGMLKAKVASTGDTPSIPATSASAAASPSTTTTCTTASGASASTRERPLNTPASNRTTGGEGVDKTASNAGQDTGVGIAGGGGGGGGSKTGGTAQRKVPTKFLALLHEMLIDGSPHIWWERETGSVVVEDADKFHQETMPRYFADPKLAGFHRQLNMYGFKKPNTKSKDPAMRWQHPECRWKDVSCVKTLLTKKAYEQRRLENAIRNTAAGAAPRAAPVPPASTTDKNDNSNGDSTSIAGDVSGNSHSGSNGCNEGALNSSSHGETKSASVASATTSTHATASALEETTSISGPSSVLTGGSDDKIGVIVIKPGMARAPVDSAESIEAERTELEIATEAAVVKARSTGRDARKELRRSISRGQMGRWELEQVSKLMLSVMRLNATLLKGIKECKERRGPPPRCRFTRDSSEIARLRLERVKLRRRVRQLEDEVEAKGMTLPPYGSIKQPLILNLSSNLKK